MPIERKLAAIMFTDIAGYTALSAKDENKALELLDKQKQILTPIIEEFNGTLHNKGGDSLLFTFSTVTDAVKCGIKIQKQIKAVEDLNLRIGIHEGEITLKDGDVLGDDVNIASRIEPFSAVGGISISGKIQQNISSLPEFETTYVGTPKLKGVSQEVKVYCITSHGLPETDVSKVSAKLEEKSKFNIFTLTGGILTAIGVAFWIAVGVFDISFGGKTEVPSIAIIPFDNKGAESDEFYAYSLSTDLRADVLSSGLIWVPRKKDIEDAMDLPIDKLAKKLLVRYVVTGDFWKVDSIFQLSMEMYDTKKSKVLWSKSWKKKWSELSSIKDVLADNILTSLKVYTKQDIFKTSITNVEAYEYYLLAKYKWEKRTNIEDTEFARALLKKAIGLDDKLLVAKNLLGYTYKEMGDNDKALEIYTQNLKQAEQLGDKQMIESALFNISSIYKNQGDSETALEYYTRTIKISEELDNKWLVAESVMSIGLIYKGNRNLKKALDFFTLSYEKYEKYGDRDGMAGSLLQQGFIQLHMGNYNQALDNEIRSRKIFEEVGYKDYIELTLFLIGTIYHFQGDFDKALDYNIRALTLAEEIGDKAGIGRILFIIGNVYLNNGDYRQAEEYLDKSFSIQKEIGLNEIEIATTISLYLTYKHLGKEYDVNEIHSLHKSLINSLGLTFPEFEVHYRLYELLEDKSFLETAYNQIQETADNLEPDIAAKFLSYPIPKSIVEEWEKVK